MSRGHKNPKCYSPNNRISKYVTKTDKNPSRNKQINNYNQLIQHPLSITNGTSKTEDE
jgi:hypothetical protein